MIIKKELLLAIICLILILGKSDSSDPPSTHLYWEDSDFFNMQFKEITKEWNIDLALEYRNLSGLGFAESKDAEKLLDLIKIQQEIDRLRENLKENKESKEEEVKLLKIILGQLYPLNINKNLGVLFYTVFYKLKWEHIVTKTANPEETFYTYTIIRNVEKKKIVCTFSGSKYDKELEEQMILIGGSEYEFLPGKNIKIMKYYYDLYQTIREDLLKNLEIARIPFAKDDPDLQIVFTGHSKGSAMSTVIIFDLLMRKSIPRTAKSPVLINYGGPRAGNYVFANELSKMVPIIFRHVNQWDGVTQFPACIAQENGDCINEYQEKELNSNLSLDGEFQYEIKIKDPQFFYPWHPSGFILIKEYDNAFHSFSCASSEPRVNNNEDQCINLIIPQPEYHRFYYGFQVSEIWKPWKFNIIKGKKIR